MNAASFVERLSLSQRVPYKFLHLTCVTRVSLSPNLQAAKDREVKDAQTNKSARGNDSTDTDSSGDEGEGGTDDESRRRLESGGRDKVAYFFWQGRLNADLPQKVGLRRTKVHSTTDLSYTHIFHGQL